MTEKLFHCLRERGKSGTARLIFFKYFGLNLQGYNLFVRVSFERRNHECVVLKFEMRQTCEASDGEIEHQMKYETVTKLQS